jgi:hypothetical protein
MTAPWSAYVSARAHHLTLFTTGDAPVLFSGTCLPCDGTLQGMKRVYGDETRRLTKYRSLRDIPNSKLPASAVLDVIAARHPNLSRESALRVEAIRNVRYSLSHPLQYLGMEWRKLGPR